MEGAMGHIKQGSVLPLLQLWFEHFSPFVYDSNIMPIKKKSRIDWYNSGHYIDYYILVYFLV